MWWRHFALAFALLPGSHALDSSIVPLEGRADEQCVPGSMSGSRYCPPCEGITAPPPNMFIKSQDKADKTTDDQNNAYQEQHGECRVYHPQWGSVSTGQEQPKCERWCKAQGSEGEGVAACVGFTPKTGDPNFDN